MSPRRTTLGDHTDGTPDAGPDASAVAAGSDRIVDPRAVRIALGLMAAHAEAAPIVIEPPAVPLLPDPRVGSPSLHAGVAVVDGHPMHVGLDHLGLVHRVLVEGRDDPTRTHVLLLPVEAPSGSSGIVRREVVVDGWRIEVEIESERRASLRERARRGREATARGGPTEVRAIIPGQVVSVSVVPGDAVVAGQQLLVVEAMKMQNELRAPRDGVISKVAVGAGRTIEVGDLLLVLE